MNQISIPVVKLPNSYDLPLPSYPYELASDMTLTAAINNSIRIPPKERTLVPTGLIIALPTGIEAQIRTHSQSAFEKGLVVCDSPSSIDPTFRDEIKCLLLNTSDEVVIIKRGQAIASLHFAPVITAAWNEMHAE